MACDERALFYINRANQLCDNLKAQNITETDLELAMTVRNESSKKYELQIIAIDSIVDDEKLTLVFMKGELYRNNKEL